MAGNHFVIVTTFYNAGTFLDLCSRSLVTQDYDNFRVIFIDDASLDEAPARLPTSDPRVTVIRNTERKGMLTNIHDAIMRFCQPDDIVAIVDGDDWLPHKYVLTAIDELYREHECWIMYSQSIWSYGVRIRCGSSGAYTAEEFARLRTVPFKCSHLRTFRAGVFQMIGAQDPELSCFRDNSGRFFTVTGDMAIMFPILEMAGFERVHFSREILYVYNITNPINDVRVNKDRQQAIDAELRARPPFRRIASYRKLA